MNGYIIINLRYLVTLQRIKISKSYSATKWLQRITRNTWICRKRPFHRTESPSLPEGKQVPRVSAWGIWLHYCWRGHCRMPIGSNPVPEVQGTSAGERWVSIQQPQHHVTGELPHLLGRCFTRITSTRFYLHGRCDQCPCKGPGWWNLYQRRLLQPGKTKVHNCHILIHCILFNAYLTSLGSISNRF